MVESEKGFIYLMLVEMTHGSNTYQFNTDNAISIAITLHFNSQQPNHFGAEVATKTPLIGGEFIGDTKRGGSCNADSITLVPHCNGTHTETVNHIVHQKVPIGVHLSHGLSLCQLITVTPVKADDSTDNYLPELDSSDDVIDLSVLQSQLNQKQLDTIQSLVIRTLPNHETKKACVYDGQHQYPFFTLEAMSWLAESGIKHLLVDMPSVDKMYDDGQLSNHHIYWNVVPQSRLLNDESHTDRTITEMVFVDDKIEDGLF
ncbi:MAG: cyclase family protein, partial [Marinicellaceae bacterium]